MSIGLTMKSLLFFIFILCVMIFIKSVFDEWDWCTMYKAKCCFFMVSIFTVIDLPVSIFEWQIKTTAICWYGELFPLAQVQNFCASWLYSLRCINAQLLGLSHFSKKKKNHICIHSNLHVTTGHETRGNQWHQIDIGNDMWMGFQSSTGAIFSLFLTQIYCMVSEDLE